MSKINAVVTVFFLLCSASIRGQIYVSPNYGLKSPETLEITKLEMTEEATILYMSLENRITGGSFCADKNIVIVYPDGTRLSLLKAEGIPVCPDQYKFRSIGEKLDFILRFPPLKPGTEWVDIIEECSSDCFWFYGVTLDNELNRKLDEAFLIAAQNKPSGNISLFKTMLDSIDDQNLGIEGLVYINIIYAAREDSDNINAMVYYKRLASSKAPRAVEYLKHLNNMGIKY